LFVTAEETEYIPFQFLLLKILLWGELSEIILFISCIMWNSVVFKKSYA